VFWEQVESNGLLAWENLILDGDLNFTTNIDEVWGVDAHPDPLAGFFRDLFQKNRMVDVKPLELVPTWCNDRSGEQNIQKRMDIVYVVEGLLHETARFRSWVELPYFSDHVPIFFQLNNGYRLVAYPFKFNHAILKDESFGVLVQSVWNAPYLYSVAGAQRKLLHKLINLKNHTKSWQAQKKITDNRALKSLAGELVKLTKQSWEIRLSHDQGAHLKKLELDQNSYLMEQEARWRLKI
jgi:hypothetical protein